MEPPLMINLTIGDFTIVMKRNSERETALALENEALKRMVREMQANADEAKSEDPPEAGNGSEEPGETPQAAD